MEKQKFKDEFDASIFDKVTDQHGTLLNRIRKHVPDLPTDEAAMRVRIRLTYIAATGKFLATVVDTVGVGSGIPWKWQVCAPDARMDPKDDLRTALAAAAKIGKEKKCDVNVVFAPVRVPASARRMARAQAKVGRLRIEELE